MLPRQLRRFLMQFTVRLAAAVLNQATRNRIGNNGKRGVGGRISQNRHGCELSVSGTREFDRRTERTLRLRQFIQGDDDLGKHKVTRVELIRVLSYESNSSGRYYIFLVVIAPLNKCVGPQGIPSIVEAHGATCFRGRGLVYKEYVI